MAVAVQEAPARPAEAQENVNDFAISVATTNGSGSQTSNGVLVRAFFKMGIPVTARTSSPAISRDCPPGT